MAQVLIDNLIDVFLVYIGVPDAIRIDHDDRTFTAPVHAARGIDAYAALA